LPKSEFETPPELQSSFVPYFPSSSTFIFLVKFLLKIPQTVQSDRALMVPGGFLLKRELLKNPSFHKLSLK